jgi:predicted negative regulator of RcsB-dependent stress response
MAYDLEEQEQLAELKAFWNNYGNLISWILILALGSFAAYQGWNRYQASKAAEASHVYIKLQNAIDAKDKATVDASVAELEKAYAGTVYAPLAALNAAKLAFDAKDLKTAKAQLQWTIDHGNDELVSIARLRLAGVLLDEKSYDAALAAMATGVLPQFAPAVNDRKGDILVAQNKPADARAAYTAALAGMDELDPARQLVRLKLESIGGTVPAAPAPAAPAPAAPKAAA